MTYLDKKTWRIDRVVMGDLPKEKEKSGLIVMGDLPRWKNGLIVIGDLQVEEWSHCNG